MMPPSMRRRSAIRATAAGERLLAWYFEEHLRFPFLDRDLERQAVGAAGRSTGRSLFGQVFGGAAAHDYRGLREPVV